MDVVFHPKALIEYRESFVWYNEQQAGLGSRFEAAVDSALKDILDHPEYYTMTPAGFQQVLVKIFPFVIVYKYIPAKEIIYVSSIFHTSRHPQEKYRN